MLVAWKKILIPEMVSRHWAMLVKTLSSSLFSSSFSSFILQQVLTHQLTLLFSICGNFIVNFHIFLKCGGKSKLFLKASHPGLSASSLYCTSLTATFPRIYFLKTLPFKVICNGGGFHFKAMRGMLAASFIIFMLPTF